MGGRRLACGHYQSVGKMSAPLPLEYPRLLRLVFPFYIFVPQQKAVFLQFIFAIAITYEIFILYIPFSSTLFYCLW